MPYGKPELWFIIDVTRDQNHNTVKIRTYCTGAFMDWAHNIDYVEYLLATNVLTKIDAA